MNFTLPSFSRERRWLRLSVLLLATVAPAAQAVNFESYYGQAETRDDGQDVKTAKFCPDGGSILVGTRALPDGTTQALATRIRDDGTTLWQRGYSVNGSKQTSANAVVELNDGTGFALTGSVLRDPGVFIYVMRIDCEGKVAWATLLQNQKEDYRAAGYDIIQSVDRGAPAPFGDLVVVGDEVADPRSGSSFGRIARLTAAGAVTWSQAYSRSDIAFGLRFRAVTENLAASGAPTDLVVGGSAADAGTWNSDRRALMFRVDGGGTPVCNAILGQKGENTDFQGVTPLSLGNYRGETVLVGSTGRVDALAEGYAARFSAASCSVKAQSEWMDPEAGNVVAYDVAEVRDADGGPGSVAATGTLSGHATFGFLLSARLADLGLNSPPGARLFGTQREAPENLYAMDVKSDRFVLAGSTYEDWDGVGDPQDFYFVQTDPAFNTMCSKVWEPRTPVIELPAKRFSPKVLRLPEYTRVEVRELDADGEGICCERDPPPERCPGVIDNGTVQLGVSSTGYLNVECDPPNPSSGRYGTTLVGLRLMETNADASAPGSPCEGWGVASADLGVTGYTSRCSGTVNMAVGSFSYTLSSAVSTVTIGSTFRVTHQYDPTPITPFLYRVAVTIENIGSVPVLDLRYSRGVDYDVAPNGFSEYITIAGSAAPFVIASYDNGFNSPNPLAAHSGFPGDFVDRGPGDLGAFFDLQLGTLKANEKRTFVTYYGAAPDEPNALNALGLVSASVYSLGQPDWDGSGVWPWWPTGAGFGTLGAITGKPNTFMYGVEYRRQ